MSMATDPAVSSVECDCYRQVNTSLTESGDSSPDLYKVARRLSVQGEAPWGIDRIDTDGEPAVRSCGASNTITVAMALAPRTAARACEQCMYSAPQKPTMALLSSYPASYPRPSLRHRRRDRRQL
jgi:hypothetical protein